MVAGLQTKKVLLVQSAGFLAIIALTWLDELTSFHSLLLGTHPFISDFRKSAMEMLLILVVWWLVASSTRRVLAMMRELEAFMRVCAWCRKVEHGGRWIHFDEFLREGFNTPTSHGICEECAAKQKAAIEQAKRERLAPETHPARP
jgi:hypothetical protein